MDQTSQLTDQFRELRLPSFRDHFQQSAIRAATENLSHLEYLAELTTLECEARRQGRIKRLMRNSKLPPEKSWESFKFSRLPLNVKQQLETLRDGSFLDRRENVLIFGRPGSGKSHALSALAEQLRASCETAGNAEPDRGQVPAQRLSLETLRRLRQAVQMATRGSRD